MSESTASKEDAVQRAKALHQLVRDALNRQMRLHPAPRASMDAKSSSKGVAAPEGG